VDVLGLSYGQASRTLKIPAATVATRVFRARGLLAARLVAPASRVPNGAGVRDAGGARPTRGPRGA
jgi:hypothetical protein